MLCRYYSIDLLCLRPISITGRLLCERSELRKESFVFSQEILAA